MELARISLNIENQAVRRDLADPYEMHSTLARAFTTDDHQAPARFLWRSEADRNGQHPFVLVQSAEPGSWDALQRAVPGWVARVEVRQWMPAERFAKGMPVMFRLRANPTVTRSGKRLGLWREEEQREWFDRQSARAGLRDVQLLNLASERLVGRRRKDGGATVTVCAALFEGFAQVADGQLLAAAVMQGIGHAKMMGLGLLSLAPHR